MFSSNPKFSRADGSDLNYYDDEIQIQTYTDGPYSFRSSSDNSTGLYGCLYDGSFDPSNSSQHKLTCDDNSGGNSQFLFTQNLNSDKTYILIVTTSLSNATCNYSIEVTGPSSIRMILITPERSK